MHCEIQCARGDIEKLEVSRIAVMGGKLSMRTPTNFSSIPGKQQNANQGKEGRKHKAQKE
jgi:hypothetical protein